MTNFLVIVHIFWQTILDIIFPKQCFGCDSFGAYLCIDCQNILPYNKEQRCIVCQKRSLEGFTHPKCKTRYTPDRLITIFNYQQPTVAKLITIGKYQFVPELFGLLAKISTRKVKKSFTNPELYSLCAIPLHKNKLRWRGFNQSQIIVNCLAKDLSFLCSDIISRPRFTTAQKNLNAEARKQNIKNSFVVNDSLGLPKMIILVDDVTTTGNTFLSASKVIKKNSKCEVICLALAQD